MPRASSSLRAPARRTRGAVRFQHAVDGVLQWTKLGLLPPMSFALWRDRAGKRLADRTPMSAVLFRQSLNGLSGRIAAPDLFE